MAARRDYGLFLDIPTATSVTIFALVVAFAFPFADLAKMRKLQRQTSAPARLAAYRFVVIFLWLAAATAMFMAPPRSLLMVARSPDDFGWLYAHPWALGLSMLLVALLLALIVAPGLQCVRNQTVRQKIATAMHDMRFILPVSRVERHWWLLLSVSAGVCEELVYRGFLLEFLRGRLDGGPQLGLTAAWLLSSIAFGTAHLYQGVAGIIKTTGVGLVLGMLAILSGSLLLPIIVHVLLDAQMLWMYRPADDAPDQARLSLRLLGVTTRTISAWEAGTARMPDSRLELLRLKMNREGEPGALICVFANHHNSITLLDVVSQRNFAGCITAPDGKTAAITSLPLIATPVAQCFTPHTLKQKEINM